MSSDLATSFEKLSLDRASDAQSSSFPPLTPEQQALASQWTTLSSRFPDSLPEINSNLKDKTYILGNFPTATDAVVFAAALPFLKAVKPENYAENRHLLRWADLIQNTLVEVPEGDRLVVDFSVQLPREIKAKPEKKPAAGAAAPADKKAEAKKSDKKAEPKTTEAKPAGDKTPEQIAAEKKAKAEAKKAAKAKANAEKAAKEKAAQVPPNPSMIDFRVGFIEKAIRHPDADGLYVSTIHMGDEEGPRTICSGLVKYVSLEDMQQRYIVTIANLKPVTMRGIKSMGMVLCASDENKDVVEFVNPPAGSQPGDKLFFEGYDGEPLAQLNPKKKIWEACQPNFSTNDKYEVVYKQEGKPDAKLVNKKGEVLHNSTIINAHVS